MDRERSDVGRRGLKGGQLGAGVASVMDLVGCLEGGGLVLECFLEGAIETLLPLLTIFVLDIMIGTRRKRHPIFLSLDVSLQPCSLWCSMWLELRWTVVHNWEGQPGTILDLPASLFVCLPTG